MKIVDKDEIRDLEWLVDNRSRNQRATLEVYKLIDREKEKLERSRRDRAFAHCLSRGLLLPMESGTPCKPEAEQGRATHRCY